MTDKTIRAEEIVVRPYNPADRDKIREISYDTALMGDSAEAFFEDRDVLADAVTVYYTDHEPESTFVAEFRGDIVGYITGCADTGRYKKAWVTKIFPGIAVKCIKRSAIFKPKAAKFLRDGIKSFFKGELKKPALAEYPAHFHINIVKDCRNTGVGSKLVARFIEYLRTRNVKGMHVSTVSGRAALFFKKMGFDTVCSRPITGLNHISDKTIFMSVMARRI